MTFSVHHNPYFPMFPHIPYPPTDSNLAQKALAFRQTLSSRLHNSCGIDLINSILSSYATAKTPRQDSLNLPKLPHPSLNPLFASAGWFHQALASTLQAGPCSLTRQLPEDLSMSATPARSSEMGPTMLPKVPRRPLPSGYKCKPPHHTRDGSSRLDKIRIEPLLYCQPTFYPILKDQVERAHQSWRTSDSFRLHSSLQFHETGTLVPSLIDGEVIMGFNVWGEKRLCLPHLFRFVLNDVDLKAIDEACTKLQITCTTCSPAQLTLLHARKILPQAVSSCGLIRKSDAERLTKFIRNRVDLPDKSGPTFPRESMEMRSGQSCRSTSVIKDGSSTNIKMLHDFTTKSAFGEDSHVFKRPKIEADERTSQSLECGDNSSCTSSCSRPDEPIPVIHECFGSQLGFVHPDLYTDAIAKCIECQTCHRLFSPDQFVGHTHTVTEVDNLNHWGFDSSNWRCYLRLYSGRRSRWSQTNPCLSQQDEFSDEDLLEPDLSSTKNAEVHRRLEEFKIKFAQPIRLPASLSAALRTVGLCASVAPIPPPTAAVSDHPKLGEVSAGPQKSPQFILPKAPISKEHPVSTSSNVAMQSTSSLMPAVMLPQLTLRRLWAPNDGRIRVPPPPMPSTTRDTDVFPKRLHTGPPLLLHAHRVVSQAAADKYDRDFIPNVCLMPPLRSKYGSIYGRYRRRSSFRRGWNWSSGSRSRSDSRHSSGSSSSRTRSISVSSTSSSSCSFQGRAKRHCNGLPVAVDREKRTRHASSSSDASIRVDDDPAPHRRISCRLTTHSKARSHSWSFRPRSRSVSHVSDSAHSDSVVSFYDRQLTETRRHRSRSLNTSFTPPSPTTMTSQSDRPVYTSECGNAVQSRLSPTTRARKIRRSMKVDSAHYSPQDRALAAAKAAQGAASRICPGLWSRHFTNLKNSNKGPLNLPNAREPQAAGDGESQHQLGSSCVSTTPVLVTSPTKNSLPAAVLALEAIWADLVRHINEYTVAVESRCGVDDARQRLFEQFIAMQTCYATHIAALMSENQKLNEQVTVLQSRYSANATTLSATSTQQPSQLGSEKDHFRCGIPSGHGIPDCPSEGDVDIQIPRITTHTLYPHRNRKESSRHMSDNRPGYCHQSGIPFHPTTQQSDKEYSGYRRPCSLDDPASISTTMSLMDGQSSDQHRLTRPVSQPRYAVSPVYTTSSSDDTTRTSSTPTASEIDGLAHEEKFITVDGIPSAFRVERLFNSVTPSSPISATYQSSETEQVLDDCIRIPTTKHSIDPSDRSRVNGQLPSNLNKSTRHHPYLLKRRSLLPQCENRPRPTLKPQSRLITRS